MATYHMCPPAWTFLQKLLYIYLQCPLSRKGAVSSVPSTAPGVVYLQVWEALLFQLMQWCFCVYCKIKYQFILHYQLCCVTHPPPIFPAYCCLRGSTFSGHLPSRKAQGPHTKLHPPIWLPFPFPVLAQNHAARIAWHLLISASCTPDLAI